MASNTSCGVPSIKRERRSTSWANAAGKFFRRLLKKLQDVPRVLITDQFASYGAEKREVLPRVEHRQHERRNNRAEHSHQPTRERERRMRRLKRPGHAQRFLAAYGPIAAPYRETRTERCQTWCAVTGTTDVLVTAHPQGRNSPLVCFPPRVAR